MNSQPRARHTHLFTDPCVCQQPHRVRRNTRLRTRSRRARDRANYRTRTARVGRRYIERLRTPSRASPIFDSHSYAHSRACASENDAMTGTRTKIRAPAPGTRSESSRPCRCDTVSFSPYSSRSRAFGHAPHSTARPSSSKTPHAESSTRTDPTMTPRTDVPYLCLADSLYLSDFFFITLSIEMCTSCTCRSTSWPRPLHGSASGRARCRDCHTCDSEATNSPRESSQARSSPGG